MVLMIGWLFICKATRVAGLVFVIHNQQLASGGAP